MQTVNSGSPDPIDPWELEACAVLLQPALEPAHTVVDESCAPKFFEVGPAETLNKPLQIDGLSDIELLSKLLFANESSCRWLADSL